MSLWIQIKLQDVMEPQKKKKKKKLKLSCQFLESIYLGPVKNWIFFRMSGKTVTLQYVTKVKKNLSINTAVYSQ